MLEIGIIESVRRSYSFWGEVKTEGPEMAPGKPEFFWNFLTIHTSESRYRGIYLSVDFKQD